MMHKSFATAALLLSFFSSSVLAVPHVNSNHARHAQIARGNPLVPVVQEQPIVPELGVLAAHRRELTRRCKARTPPAAPSTSTSSTPTPEPTTSTKKEEPTTTKKAEPTTTKQPDPTTTKTTKAADPTTTKSSNNGGNAGGYYGGTNHGQLTFYATGLGACGWYSPESDYIAAVSFPLFYNYPGYTGNPNTNPMCGRKINITYKGKTITVTAVDSCEACAAADLDLSPAAFHEFDDGSAGRLSGMTWSWA